MSAWPADHVPTRTLGVGTLNMKLPEAHPVCTICGCDCTGFRFEFYGFTTIHGLGTDYPVELVLITTCGDHFGEPLAARLKAAS